MGEVYVDEDDVKIPRDEIERQKTRRKKRKKGKIERREGNTNLGMVAFFSFYYTTAFGGVWRGMMIIVPHYLLLY